MVRNYRQKEIRSEKDWSVANRTKKDFRDSRNCGAELQFETISHKVKAGAIITGPQGKNKM